jgi:RNA polymerase sigma-70 factor, ECF subfamily
MSTPSPRTFAESASSTIDPDAQARHATDGELSARFQSDVIPLREPLYRHAMRMTRNHADAEDLLQDTLVKAYADLRSFKQGTNFRSWLFRIMTNTYIDDYRKTRRHPAQYPTGLITEARLATAAHHWSTGPLSVEEQALNRLGDSTLQAAMCTLPEQFRLAVYYADVEGLRSREIADLMHTPVGTVMSRLHRGRRLLRNPAMLTPATWHAVGGIGVLTRGRSHHPMLRPKISAEHRSTWLTACSFDLWRVVR